jgi:methionyl aminopeptidase
VVNIKSLREVDLMKRPGRIVAQILREMGEMVAPGVTTYDIDRFAESRIKELGAVSAFKGYHGFPACVCISVNEEVVHGIPSKKRKLGDGDIVGIDFGVSVDGWFGDSARTYAVGRISSDVQNLLEVTEKSLHLGIAQCRVGNRIFDIGHAVQSHVEAAGYSVVREFVGHGIGRALHEDPQVPNFGAPGKGPVIKEGMVLAIEPMVNMGSHRVRVLADGWTAVTEDKKLSAHFEHTVAVTAAGPVVLTQED